MAKTAEAAQKEVEDALRKANEPKPEGEFSYAPFGSKRAHRIGRNFVKNSYPLDIIVGSVATFVF